MSDNTGYTIDLLNALMKSVFNEMLLIEETALKSGAFRDLSITEMHTIDAIGMYDKPTMSEAAKKLSVTVGTLTVAVSNLASKGYVTRLKSNGDKRLVMLGLTGKGRLAFRIHDKFHREMVKMSVKDLESDEETALIKALSGLQTYLTTKFIDLFGDKNEN